jgi:hypothetical protein
MKQYTNRNWLYKMYIENNLSQKSIAKLCGINQSIISRKLSYFHIPTRKFCGRSDIYCSRYKGGRTKTSKGYIHILSHNHPRVNSRKYVPEQILIAEKQLNRFLSEKEVIHHINEIKDDNRIENLYLFPSEQEHQRYHQNLRRNNIKPITKSNLFSKNE